MNHGLEAPGKPDRGQVKNGATATAAPSSPLQGPSPRIVVAALAGMAAAWVAAGSTGLVANPLRHGSAWIALAVTLIAAWPARQSGQERFVLVAVLLLAVGMLVPAMPVYNVLAVSLVLSMLARARRGLDGRLLLLAALAAAVLGVYVLASTSIATAWSLADAFGRALGRVAATLTGKPLAIGASFAGLDFLVLMAALYAGWLSWTSPPRWGRAMWAAVAILGGHVVYLVVLCHAMGLHDALPPAPPPPEYRDYIPPPWSWSDAARSLLPWNVPLVAGLIHLAIAAAMFRWAAWLPVGEAESRQEEKAPRAGKRQHTTRSRHAERDTRLEESPQLTALLEDPGVWAVGVLAVLLALVTTLAAGRSSLSGKTIVACNQGYLDWEKPVHGQYGQASAGMYGMLPDFVASLGGRFERSDELLEAELAEADVVLVIHPVGSWPQERVDRLRSFVRDGGSLLLLAGTPVQEGDLSSSYNEVLKQVLGSDRPGVQVGFDVAVPVAWNWQDSYVPLAHAALTGVEDGRNRYGMTLGPSLRVRWPARPVLVGRWGWSDPGIDSVLTRTYGFDAGERLGDLVLAAEEKLGQGTVMVLSDTAGFTNQGNVNCYLFTGRVLAYLAGTAGNAQAAWRQALGLLGCVALVGLMVWRLSPARMATAAIALALALAGSRALGHASMRVLPDGREHEGYNNVAYIDSSHMEAYGEVLGEAGWGFDGVAGLALTLMRNGLQPFLLPELTSERLDRAGMLISIAPARPFSSVERAAVRRFVESGGIFVSTVSADHVGPVQPLLDEFQLGVPPIPIRAGEEGDEPAPMGNFQTLYRPPGADYDAGLLFYHGWPVQCPKSDQLVLGFDDLPIVAVHAVQKGKVVLIGDSAFAMNKNLEYVGGQPFDGRYDNAHFWRWLLTSLTGQESWLPPPAERPEADAASEDEPSPGGQDEPKTPSGEGAR